jgi:hypothetical protein
MFASLTSDFRWRRPFLTSQQTAIEDRAGQPPPIGWLLCRSALEPGLPVATCMVRALADIGETT